MDCTLTAFLSGQSRTKQVLWFKGLFEALVGPGLGLLIVQGSGLQFYFVAPCQEALGLSLCVVCLWVYTYVCIYIYIYICNTLHAYRQTDRWAGQAGRLRCQHGLPVTGSQKVEESAT